MQLEGLINKRAMRNEVRLVCHFIRPNTWQVQDKDIDDILRGIDWELFYRIAFYQGVSEIIYINASDFHRKFILNNVLELLKKKYYMSIFRNNLLLKEFASIAKEFDSNCIKFIPFKGIIFNNLIYPEGFVRDMQDVDIMIAIFQRV